MMGQYIAITLRVCIGDFCLWAARGLGAGFGLWIALKTTGLLP